MTSEAPSPLLSPFGGLKDKAAKHREDKVNFKACERPHYHLGDGLYDGQVGRVQRAVTALPQGLLPFPGRKWCPSELVPLLIFLVNSTTASGAHLQSTLDHSENPLGPITLYKCTQEKE